MSTVTLPTSHSLRSRLLRLTTRWLITPIFRSGHTPQVQRRLLESVSKLSQVLTPSGIRYTQNPLGGVPTEWVENMLTPVQGHLLYLHGGAYVIGSPKTHRNLTAHLAKRCGLRVAALDYRLAPEHPFPAAVEDALAAYRDLLKQGIAPNEILIGGDSAGGGLALACALAIRDAGLPQPAGLICISPWADLTLTGESLAQQRNTEVILTPQVLADAAAQYLGKATAQHPQASPLFADLRGLPPLLIQVTDAEILYSDSTRLAKAAERQGVHTTLQIAPGLWHDWQLFAGQMPEADAALNLIRLFCDERLKSA
jgi:monoterpene epsilon-lactone hydrolase